MNRSAETAVREQAAQLATAWSGAGAPSSWSLTAALFATLPDDPDPLALAARIDPDRLPAVLFVAAVMALLERQRPEPLARGSCRRRGRSSPRCRRTSPPSCGRSASSAPTSCSRWPHRTATR
jgi:hypothetical protein